MATLYITELSATGLDFRGHNPLPESPPLAEQTVAIGGASAQSAALNANTRIVRLHADAICSVAVGANPTAAATNMRLAAGQTEYFSVGVKPGGLKVAVITNT